MKKPAQLISAVDASTAFLARYGCKGSPDLRSTTDGGATTTALTSPAPHLLRVVATDLQNLWVIGADAKCHPTYYATTDGGQTWGAADSLGEVWIALPAGVHTPKGKVAKPCGTKAPGPVALSPAGSKNAFVVCSQGVQRTSNGGRTWRALSGLPAGQVTDASLATGGKAVVAIHGADGCSGLLLVATANGGRRWTAGQCLKDLKAGTAIAITDSGAGLAVGSGASYATSDAGKTWVAAA